MKKMDVNYLRRKAHWHELTPEELKEVVQRIQNYKIDQDDNIYGLLHTLGYSCASEYRGLVEDFLIYPQDPFAAKIALEVLCMDWGLTLDYRDIIESFVKRVEWDVAEEVRIVALFVAGDYVWETKDRKILQCLFDVLYGEKERQLIQETAYAAISRAIGKNWDQIPDYKNFSHDDIDQAVIAQARQMLGEESASI